MRQADRTATLKNQYMNIKVKISMKEKKLGGRPKLASYQKRTKCFRVMFTENDYIYIQSKAEQAGMPVNEFCHQAAVRGVEARMDNGAVGLAGAAADVLLALEHEEAALTAAEIPGDGAARHARADNDHIIHKITSK